MSIWFNSLAQNNKMVEKLEASKKPEDNLRATAIDIIDYVLESVEIIGSNLEDAYIDFTDDSKYNECINHIIEVLKQDKTKQVRASS